MRRISPTLPVPPTLFRHFAVITILITACIALFADGERRDAIGAELAAQQQKTALAHAEAGSLGANKTKSKVVYYPARGGGGGGFDSGTGDSGANTMGTTQQIAEGGSFRLARETDYGRVDYNPAAITGPPGLAELHRGMSSSVRIGNPRKRSGGGANAASRGPTDAQRNSIDEEGFRRAGTPTPPK